jgi:hypothetical protein
VLGLPPKAKPSHRALVADNYYTETRAKGTIEQRLRGLTSSLIDEISEHKAEESVRLTRIWK